MPNEKSDPRNGPPVPHHNSAATGSRSPRPSRRNRRDDPAWLRPVAGMATIGALVGIVALAAGLFQGGLFTASVPVTVVSPRAGLVMNPDAKVKLLGVQVGKVSSIASGPDGRALLHLEIDPEQLRYIPENVHVGIESTTVFGAKFVQLIPPANPSADNMYAGQTLEAENVTVEFNTVFQQLVTVLDKVEPDKLNETLGAVAAAFDGRGPKAGQMISDFNSMLTQLDPSLETLRHELSTAPEVARAFGDAGPDLISIFDNVTKIGQTLVEKEHGLDALLVSTIGLGDIGNDVIGTNRQPLTDAVHLLLPTTDLTNKYHENLNCSVAGLVPLAKAPPSPVPGVYFSIGMQAGVERYRYPDHLPKVAAKSGTHCEDMGLPTLPPNFRPPFLTADIGANPWEYGNQGLLLNSDALKQFLFGPIAGPPRNSSQVGQPG